MPESRNRRRRGRQSGRGSRSAQAAAELSINRPRTRKTNYWYLAASVIIAFLVIAGFVVADLPFFNQGIGPQTGSSSEYVEGVGEQQVVMPTRNHVDAGQTVAYDTTPPTSGDHWNWWARCGFYEDGLPDERIVHNLEHGNIVVSYNLPPPDVTRLREFMDDFDMAPIWAVTRYYDKIPEGTVALSAWGILDTMQGVDEDRIETFFEHYAGTTGPEFPDGSPCTTSGLME